MAVPLDYNFKVSCQHIIVILLRWSPLYQSHKNKKIKIYQQLKIPRIRQENKQQEVSPNVLE